MSAPRNAALASLAVLIALSASSCVTTFCEGRHRPESEIAIVESRGTVIDEIDGKNVQQIRANRSRYLLPAGPHVLGFSVQLITPDFGPLNTTSNFLRVCLMAKSGHRYVTRADVGSNEWRPLILDTTAKPADVPAGDGTGLPADVPAGLPISTDCSQERLFPPTISRGPSPVVAAEPPKHAEVLAPSAPVPAPEVAPETTSTPTTAPDGAGTSVPLGKEPTPPTGRPRSVSGGAEAIRLWSHETIAPRPVRPFFDLVFSVGLAFGGDTLVTTQFSNGNSTSLDAGQGLTLDVGAMLTPVWLTNTVGLGAGASVGLKYDGFSVSNASISFTRFPATGTLHALIRVGESWYVLVAAGVEKDLNSSLSGDGDASDVHVALTSRTGALGRLGMYWRFGQLAATMFGIGYTHLTYDAPGGSVDASSFGLWFTINAAL